MITSVTVARKDAGAERTWMYSQRVTEVSTQSMSDSISKNIAIKKPSNARLFSTSHNPIQAAWFFSSKV